MLADLRASHDSLTGAYRERLGPEHYDQLADLLRLFVTETGPAS